MVYLNLDLIKTTTDKVQFLFISLNRATLIPIIIIWFIKKYKYASQVKKPFLFISYILLLTLIEYIADWLGLTHHKEVWRLWWTLLEWSLILFITLVFSYIFKFLLAKEVRL